MTNGDLETMIEDNGRGFELQKVKAGGNGLGNMRTRLEECGGRMELASVPGKGTTLRFFFYLPRGNG